MALDCFNEMSKDFASIGSVLARSPPSQGRGLKLKVLGVELKDVHVAPLAGRGLKLSL